MKIFNKTEPWPEKVNFVDENNIMLGFDTSIQCCESADWFISDHPENKPMKQGDPNPNLEGWTFDRYFFCELDDKDGEENYVLMVIFRIVNGEEKKYIHLYNCSNGYYFHGFEFKIGENIIKKGKV